MFWSGNYIAVRELNSLLKEENVSLSQVLEADDILQECKADNKALTQFLTRPEILADLITLITEEPPKNVELASQYRLANIACEVLTSHLSMLSDRLSMDAAQMNRLCDFINRDPPLNPLLASYFSKTVEMLLEKSPKQDWCLHHIVCLRVLDFFKSRRDFLPNLLRHMSTSAIADIFKYLMRIDDLIKTVMEWLEEHQFLECLIQIICGTYVPEVFPATPAPPAQQELVEKAEQETSEKPEANHTDEKDHTTNSDGDTSTSKHDGSGDCDEDSTHATRSVSPTSAEAESKDMRSKEGESERAEAEDTAKAIAAERMAAAASANAAALLCDLIVNGCRARSGWAAPRQSARGVLAALAGARGVHALLRAMFTSPARARHTALVHGAQVLLALLHLHRSEAGEEEGGAAERNSVELAVAPHVPLLHQALLAPPLQQAPLQQQQAPQQQQQAPRRVGLARVQVAALLAHLALSEVEEVATTMLTLGTPGVLVDMFFEYPNNNFLHAQVYTLVKHALTNKVYRTQYARHLLIECDLVTRLMDAFEENRSDKCAVRAALCGHVVLCLGELARALQPGDLPAPPRWAPFLDLTLRPLLQQHDTPLGGYYPSENFYEVEIMPDTLAANYDFNDMATTGTIEELAEDVNSDDVNEICGATSSTSESADFIADGLNIDDDDKLTVAKNNFLELASQRFDDDMWEDGPAPAAPLALDQHSPWEGVEGAGAEGMSLGGGEGWAQFGAAALPPSDPFSAPRDAPPDPFTEFTPFWSYDDQRQDGSSSTELEENLRGLRLGGESLDEPGSAELANNLLTAMSAMSPDAIANIVNANLPANPAPGPHEHR